MISVCLATHNGEKYLGAQIASILPQLTAADELVIADDASTDGTLALINSLDDPRIRLFSGNDFHSAKLNFAFALYQARGDVIVLADQDDVWLPGRIDAGIRRLQELERKFGAVTPLLIHSDLRVVDEQLRPVADSLWQYQNSDPVAGVALNRLLVQNPVTGCSVMLNAALRDLALPIPEEAVMHDWWLALVAAAFGAVGVIAEPTVLYRQHRANDTGARQWGAGHIAGRLLDLGGQRLEMARLYCQGDAFLKRYRDRLAPWQIELLEAFATLDRAGAVGRRLRLIKYRFFYTGLLRNIGRLILG